MNDSIRRFSSRRQRLDREFLHTEIRGAKTYRRIAGYFTSSIFEIAQESLDGVERIEIVCNADIDARDLLVSQVAQAKLLGQWNQGSVEVDSLMFRERFRKLHDLLIRGNLEIRVAPRARCGFVHGKAGVIARPDGRKVAFIGSMNESRQGWSEHYEILWADDSEAGVRWVEDEFDYLWRTAIPLPQAVIDEAKRCAQRVEAELPDCSPEDVGPAAMVEAPLYREGLSLQPWQQGFVSQFIQHRETHGVARLLLADEVGLGKTLSMGTAVLAACLLDDKPALILAPATLTQQWQTELIDKLGIPSGRWHSQRKQWIDHRGRVVRGGCPSDVVRCPYRIGIVSTGLVTQATEERELLARVSYGVLVLDEAHKARRRQGLRGNQKANNLMEFMKEAAGRSDHVLLGTATPIQTDVQDLWDLFTILTQGRGVFALGRPPASRWYRMEEVHPYISGQTTILDEQEAWELLRNPLPSNSPSHDKVFEGLISEIRLDLGLIDNEYFTSADLTALTQPTRERLEDALSDTRAPLPFFQRHNPIVRHTILRKRSTLEAEGLIPKVGVNIHPDQNHADGAYHALFKDRALLTDDAFDLAYQAAEEFSKAMKERNPSAGFMKNLLLQRICSSCEAGRATAQRLLDKTIVEQEDEDAIIDPTDFSEAELFHLKQMRHQLERMTSDPKLRAVEHYLKDKAWLEHGCIIFSQYYDTARWVAEQLARDIPNERIALYAGADRSRVYYDRGHAQTEREVIKRYVGERTIRLMVATDAACEGLNLQALGTLINIDLPWNPTRLEQRIGRIKRFGQVRPFVDMLNLVYGGTKDEQIYARLSERMRDKFDLFGSLPDTIKDEWIDDIDELDEHMNRYIERKKRATGFDLRYNATIRPNEEDWRHCARVLSRRDIEERLSKGW